MILIALSRSCSASETPISELRADALAEAGHSAAGLLPDLAPELRPVAKDSVRAVELIRRVRARLACELAARSIMFAMSRAVTRPGLRLRG
jgi:hypothetical protein